MKKLLTMILVLLLLLASFSPVAAEEAPIPIYTVEQLQSIASNPTGSYILMQDLDMAGIPWKGPDFTGSFDGNGHALLNVTLAEVGDTRPSAFDGNAKEYEASYLGFFSSLKNAQVKNLSLINVRACLETEQPCFVGGMAGYMEDSEITNCTVTGTLELRAFDRIFGIGGMAGYGSGQILGCTLDVTLICTDTDATTRDEQFLGGVYATGFVNVQDCQISLDGYISEHGYVHSGGIVGMYMRYPLGKGTGYITGNQVSGKITFFEDNPNRRAYCDAFVGESLVGPYVMRDNTREFVRDERFDVTRELRPEMCEKPEYTVAEIPGLCHSFGYSEYTCIGCGYCYRDDYTLYAHSTVIWTLEKAPTEEEEGRSIGNCDGCGIALERTEPKLEPQPTPPPTQTQPPATQPAPVEIPREEGASWLIPASVAVILAAAGLLILRRKKKS